MAHLSDDPDPVIVRQAGLKLRAITEGAIGSLIAVAVQPAVWSLGCGKHGRAVSVSRDMAVPSISSRRF
jgi:hypothetical protein